MEALKFTVATQKGKVVFCICDNFSLQLGNQATNPFHFFLLHNCCIDFQSYLIKYWMCQGFLHFNPCFYNNNRLVIIFHILTGSYRLCFIYIPREAVNDVSVSYIVYSVNYFVCLVSTTRTNQIGEYST